VLRRSGIGHYELRRANLSALLRRVHLSGPTSRSALTSELGLNRSTIGDLTAYLESAGLVRSELPTRRVGTGRPSHVVVPDESVTVLAVSVEVDRIGAALVALGGVILERRDRRLQVGEQSVSTVVDVVADLGADLLRAQPSRCLGIGVAIPGVVRAEDGMVRFAPNLAWVDQPFTAMLREHFTLPIATGNDADLGVLAEHLRGSAVGFDDVAFVVGGVGIGVGFISGGLPIGGLGGYAGEFGHFPVDVLNGSECRCGGRGCWETKVGEHHLLAAAGYTATGVGPEALAEVLAAADNRDARAVEAVDECAAWIGVGLGGIINALNPAVIVIAGLLASVWAARPALVSASIDKVALAAPRAQVLIRLPGLGDDSTLIGAAELAFAPVLTDPMKFSQG
jgi:predicted NBD/HSP70 family sugar kinase